MDEGQFGSGVWVEEGFMIGIEADEGREESSGSRWKIHDEVGEGLGLRKKRRRFRWG